jgi:hypothetical protein
MAQDGAVVSEQGVSSVRELIAYLNSRPKLSPDEVKRKHEAYFERVFGQMPRTGATYGEATGSPGTAVTTTDEAEFRKHLRAIDNDLLEQARIVTEGVHHYFENGEYPAPYYAWRIAVVLRKAKQYQLELEFLEAFSAKFSDGIGQRYRDIAERIVKTRVLAKRSN